MEAYASEEGTDGTWTKVAGTTLVADQEGTTLQFSSPVDARYVKVHSTWDERDAENGPLDYSAVSGRPSDLVEVWTTVKGQSSSWTYDGLGNRLIEYRYRGGGSTTTSTYYANTNLVKTVGEWEYNYDGNGNLVERGTEGTWNTASGRHDWSAGIGELWRYAYDLKNRLVEVKRGTGASNLKTVATYAYDMRDLRIVTTKSEGTRYYQYDQVGDLVWTETASGATKYVQALGETWAEVRTVGTANST